MQSYTSPGSHSNSHESVKLAASGVQSPHVWKNVGDHADSSNMSADDTNTVPGTKGGPTEAGALTSVGDTNNESAHVNPPSQEVARQSPDNSRSIGHGGNVEATAAGVTAGSPNPITNYRLGSKLFVGQVPALATESVLQAVFQPFGDLLEVKIMRDHRGHSKGSAWVRYATQEMAQCAIDNLHQRYTIPPQTNPLRVQFASTASASRTRGSPFVRPQAMIPVNSPFPTPMGVPGDYSQGLQPRYSPSMPGVPYTPCIDFDANLHPNYATQFMVQTGCPSVSYVQGTPYARGVAYQPNTSAAALPLQSMREVPQHQLMPVSGSAAQFAGYSGVRR